jgi:hypothetical protein
VVIQVCSVNDITDPNGHTQLPFKTPVPTIPDAIIVHEVIEIHMVLLIDITELPDEQLHMQ